MLHLGQNQSGHNGYQSTYAAIKCLYYWKDMRISNPSVLQTMLGLCTVEGPEKSI